MLDNILNSVRRGAERVQRRGEEVAQVTKLRVEVFQLTREQDGLYARLGRSFHAGADASVLQTVQEDIRRIDEEISARERLIQELNTAAAEPVDNGAVVRQEDKMQATTTPNTVQSGATEPTVPDAMPRPTPTNPVQISKEAQPMTHKDDKPTSSPSNPTVKHSDEKLIPEGDTASTGNEAGRDKLYRHGHHLEEAENASKHPDPLDM
ncbi:hypothetical protein E7T06_13780 [Deinococcus sp. Arct2-2]|uniref:hypothetical protein n=1 Tax=Deinococcus sp. Arct2-2 TaxID=2568653 RepID=UPI0010A44B49|nr:hypothetical protein [Deinococcus sp. Arct2-2]THF69027.1 hypothetical protein E7T06_13780 [Deinococcus sp. Arct2-2]